MPLAPNCINEVSSRSSSKAHSSSVSFPGFYRVGWVKSAHGIRGEVFIALFAETADWRDQVTQFSLLPKDQSELIHFQVETMRPHKNGLIVKLQSVIDRNRSEELLKSQVYIQEACLKATPGERIFLHEILGFDVLDQDKSIGKIVGFSSNGPQDLLNVKTENGEVLVPFVEAFLVRLDFENQKVHMELPPGLIEVENPSGSD